MIYTSGTTGAPKGVLHAHRFLLGHLPSFELHHHPLGADDIGWTPADWAWIGGLMDMAMPCLFYGLPVVAQRFPKFDPKAAFDLIADLWGVAKKHNQTELINSINQKYAVNRTLAEVKRPGLQNANVKLVLQ